MRSCASLERDCQIVIDSCSIVVLRVCEDDVEQPGACVEVVMPDLDSEHEGAAAESGQVEGQRVVGVGGCCGGGDDLLVDGVDDLVPEEGGEDEHERDGNGASEQGVVRGVAFDAEQRA